MKKLRRGGHGSGDWAYNKVLKLRVMQATYDELVAMQEERGLCMAQLLRELLSEVMNRSLCTDTEEKTT